MPRKKAETLAQQREEIAARYKSNGGKKVLRGKVDPDELSDADRDWLKMKAVFLKANDASYSYISDAIRVPRGTIKHWFEEAELKTRVEEIRGDMVTGGIKYLHTYALDLLIELVAIAKNHEIDPKVRLNAITEALDRIGIAKVNKSESIVAQTYKQEFDIADPDGVLDQLRNNPQLAAAAAEKIDELSAIVGEGVVTE